MKPALRMAGLLLAAVLLQSALSRLGGGGAVDLILVAVVTVALRHGRVAGLVSGMLAGLVQDALGGGILGLSGLGKSVAGYAAGVVATQFIVNQAAPRGFLFAGASLLNSACFVGLSILLGLRRYGNPLLDVSVQAVLNGLIGVLVFAVIDAAPGARAWVEAVMERRRKRRFR